MCRSVDSPYSATGNQGGVNQAIIRDSASIDPSLQNHSINVWSEANSQSLKYVSISQEGDKLPNNELFEGDPGTKVKIGDLFGNKRGVLIGVPGAFTPGCSQVRTCMSGAHLVFCG